MRAIFDSLQNIKPRSRQFKALVVLAAARREPDRSNGE
jgi:hypothetical protein